MSPVSDKPVVKPPGPPQQAEPEPAKAEYTHCMECGRPWGAIGPHEEAEIEARAAWADWADGRETGPIFVERVQVVDVSQANSYWWADKFGASPEPGWWTDQDVGHYGVPEWALSKLKRHPAVRIANCCHVRILDKAEEA